MAGSAELSFLSEERRVVDGEEHAHRRLVHSDWWQWFRVLEVGNGITDFKLLQTDYSTDVTRVNMVGLLVSHAFKGVEFLYFSAFLCSVTMTDGDVLPILQSSTVYTTDSNTSCIA